MRIVNHALSTLSSLRWKIMRRLVDALFPFSSYQQRAVNWGFTCFGDKIVLDKVERNQRFMEEAAELVQACDMAEEEAIAAVRYAYARKRGEKVQEVGGVMNTLAILCFAHGIDMADAAEKEITRVWGKVDQIREKQKLKPRFEQVVGVVDDQR